MLLGWCWCLVELTSQCRRVLGAQVRGPPVLFLLLAGWIYQDSTSRRMHTHAEAGGGHYRMLQTQNARINYVFLQLSEQPLSTCLKSGWDGVSGSASSGALALFATAPWIRLSLRRLLL